MPLNFTGYFLTDITGMSATEQTQGASGTWTIDASATSSTITVSDGANARVFSGDRNNDIPTDPTQTFLDEFIYWEVISTYSGSDGNTYTAVVFEYDLNGNGIITNSEEAFFIAFIPNGFNPNAVTLASLGNGPGGLPAGTVPPPGVTLTRISIRSNARSLTFVCLSSMSLIQTTNGPRQIGEIRTGDLVETRNGAKPIRWTGKRKFSKAQLVANPKMFPVRITKGSVGHGLPDRDLLVSRQHRLLISSTIAKRMFGHAEVLIPAIKLIEMPGIYVDTEVEGIEYCHILFDAHEVIFCEGAPTESLLPGPQALELMPPEAREEILAIFPELHQNALPAAVEIPPAKRQQRLIERHIKNAKPLLSHDALALN